MKSPHPTAIPAPATRVLAAALCMLVAAAAAGCLQSSPRTSSSSNWLVCETGSDCVLEGAPERCEAGYCIGDDGERIAVQASEPTSGQTGDGAAGQPADNASAANQSTDDTAASDQGGASSSAGADSCAGFVVAQVNPLDTCDALSDGWRIVPAQTDCDCLVACEQDAECSQYRTFEYNFAESSCILDASCAPVDLGYKSFEYRDLASP